jgi:hypothetical protein
VKPSADSTIDVKSIFPFAGEEAKAQPCGQVLLWNANSETGGCMASLELKQSEMPLARLTG